MLRQIFLILAFIFLSLSNSSFTSKTVNQSNISKAPEIIRQEVQINLLQGSLNNYSENIVTGKQGITIAQDKHFAIFATNEIFIPLTKPEPFLAFAPVLSVAGNEQQVSLYYRRANATYEWSNWEQIIIDHDASPNGSGRLTSLLFVNRDTTKVQFKIYLSKDNLQSTVTVTAMKIDFISPGATTQDSSNEKYFSQSDSLNFTESAAAKFPKPLVLTRTGWGCPDGQGNPRTTPSYTTVTHLIVHHTATENTASDWPAVVRSIWNFHIFTNGWSDIGYNYLIDPNGVIYEGRGGGDNVLGAHFSCQNGGTMGVSMLGTFTTVGPTTVARNSLIEILSWKADQRNLNPLGAAYHNGMQASIGQISGHRDGNSLPGSCTTTECPGNFFYPSLPTLRSEVNSLVNPVNDFALAAPNTKQVIAKSGTVSYQINSSLLSGAPQAIKLDLQNLPANINYFFTVPTINSGNSSQLSLTIPDTTAAGTYNFRVIGSGVTKRTVDLSLVVTGKVTSVSAATYLPMAPVAPESVIAAFGVNMASETKVATDFNLPTTLGNVTVKVKDSLGNEITAPLFYVSPTQINYQIPAALAPGLATVTVFNNSEISALGELQLSKVAAGIFSASSDGRGVAAAVFQRRQSNGTDIFEQVARYDEVQKIFVPNPLDVSNPNEEYFLLLFGTGFRNRNPDLAVTAQIGGTDVEVLYAGKQPNFVGVDQVNLRLPRTLAGRGSVNIQLMIEGQAANPVAISLK